MLVILVVVLVLNNIAMLIYFTRGKKEEAPKSRSDRQVEYIRKEMKLTDEQLERYKALRSYRDSIVRPLNDSLRVAKMRMIDHLRLPPDAVPDSALDRVAAEIADRQKPIEKEFYNHFRRVQALCNPEQLKTLDSMLVRMVIRNTGGYDKSSKKK